MHSFLEFRELKVELNVIESIKSSELKVSSKS